MNKEIELLHNKLEAQDKIINEQVLEIARLKDKNKHIEQLWKETNVIIRNEKTLAVNDNAMNYIIELETRIDKAIEYIKSQQVIFKDYDIVVDNQLKNLLEILGDKENE